MPERAAYEKFRNPASHFALVGVFVAKFASGVRVAVTGANLNDDMHASAEYRAHLIPVLAARAVARANS
ncbi:MAG: Aerobic carbon monoxide dehydrogenase (quinone), medium chain (EC [uncultured Paraburkholderia sp.]|nr:MAG: Aerobic carbon monoxide dehydrogenase (quinone), medium chain (EC [uncultured Paraburkholderia sp.]